MKHKIRKLLVCIPFLLLIFGIAATTLYSAKSSLGSSFIGTQNETVTVRSLESLLMDNLPGKDYLTALYGMSQKMLNRSYVGDNQFYQDKERIMHLKRDPQSGEKIAESIEYLSSNLAVASTPFLICQTAERAAYGDELSKYVDGGSLSYIEDIRNVLHDTDTIYLDYQELFSENGISSQDIFFKTDIHYTTEAEFFILKEIVESLENNAGLVFKNREVVLDLNNYIVEQYPFWGNLFDSVGKIYAGTDVFTYYIPDFDTSMTLTNPSANVERSGTFEDVCMNNYRNIYDSNSRAYRVTDYLQWPSPYYCITNNQVQDNDILVIGCSMGMRTTAYLSLLCHSVTVLDPRSFNETDYLAKALENEYDAVICFPSYNLLDGLGGYSAEIIEYHGICQDNGTIDIHVDVKNTGTTKWKFSDQIRMQLWLNDSDTGIRTELKPDEVIELGERYTFVFTNLPQTICAYNITAQTLREGRFYFGEKEIIELDFPAEHNALDAEILTHTTPANIKHGKAYSFDIIVKNTGESAWTSDSQIRLCLWRDANDYGYRLYIPDGVVVEPQQEYVFTMDNFLLTNEKQVYMEYQMVQEGIEYFGERESFLINAS